MLQISKRKAAWLLQNGHIKCTIGEKKTRQYSVPRSELIKYIVKCSEGNAPSIPYGIFSTQKISSLRKEKAIKISQTTITNLKIEIRAEWSKSPTVLTTTQAARLVGCSNALINSWMKQENGLRFARAQNGVFTTKEWLITSLTIRRRRISDIGLQDCKTNCRTSQVSVKNPMPVF